MPSALYPSCALHFDLLGATQVAEPAVWPYRPAYVSYEPASSRSHSPVRAAVSQSPPRPPGLAGFCLSTGAQKRSHAPFPLPKGLSVFREPRAPVLRGPAGSRVRTGETALGLSQVPWPWLICP